jgi:2-amino-4-hydroxy-6-hydroxymethyldihydropteridine diphosphokinase
MVLNSGSPPMTLTCNSCAIAAIALGSNLGNPLAMVKGAVEVLAHEATTELVAQSHWYKTIAMGPAQPDYVNGCVLVKTRRSPPDLLHLLMSIEQQFGRQRTEHWGPRTLDLDLLLYDNLVLEAAELILPHPYMSERAFVLVPLAELLPDWVHPVTGLTIAQHRDQVDCTGVAVIPFP